MNDTAADVLAAKELARSVLVSNWDGASTRPAPRLYPHQWSWDSAFIAVGNAPWRPDEAMLELRSLFAAQWSNGMLPHIVFSDDEREYFPSPGVWDSHSAPHAPSHVATSGMCQPPVHAMAARLIAARLADPAAIADEWYEPLAAWHDYLFSERVVEGGLAEIWHPWESGMDNSPLWDTSLAAISPLPHLIPTYRRSDTSIADPADRPSDAEYDRYVYIVGQLRSHDYAPTDPSTLPFRVHDVLFNAVLVRSERDLAALATSIGRDGRAHIDRADELAAHLHASLWSESDGAYRDVDVLTGEQIDAHVGGSFTALLAGPPAAVAATLVDDLVLTFAERFGDDALVVPTVAVDDDRFEPTRYWRGPAWISLMWLIAMGLDDVGRGDVAARVRRGIVQLVIVGGCGEYFDPTTGQQHGSDRFSWTGALLLDAIERLGEVDEPSTR